MDPDRWKKIEDIFQDALDVDPAERRQFIAEKAGGDEGLRAEVEKLVARFEKEEEFLESPVWTDSAVLGSTLKSRVASSLEKEMLPDAPGKSFSGRKIGVYLLTAQIGRGGMGVVYEAERIDGEFAQKAAVKLIKRGMDTDFIVRRFRHERQILASLNHPNIARLLDGGTTDEGSPYFVMEFIEGAPFLKYCEQKNLDLRQKLGLFLEVCDALAYAHRRKIIHRDIKPSNILVTDEGTPKLLDFGIAKLLDTESIHESLVPTATAMRLMTPEYASPEQVRGEEITPATDQYSLGVLLYELITGNRPYKFPSRAPHEIARVICEEIPSEPSSGSFGKLSSENAALQFDEDFCKNLDRIVLKTLRKNPAERYASVEEFAADIERFLRNERVRAESFAGSESALDFPAAKIPNGGKTSDAALETSAGNAVKASAKKQISPRRKGIKQGVFLVILTILLIPVFLIATVAAVIPPPLITLLFLVMFFGGLIRIVYAFFFESKEAPPLPPAGYFTEAETKIITNPSGRETIAGNATTAEKTVEEEKTVAVLPFKYFDSSTGEKTGGSEFLSVGLADALITRLSNVKQLLVRPTSSVLKFGAPDADAFAAGKELKVAYILTGNILRADRKVRVSIQLLDVEKRSTVWAERFDEDFTDVLDIEDSVSAKVAGSLLPRLTGEERRRLEKRGTDDPRAYEMYLRGRYNFNFYTDEGFQKAFEFYEQAIKLDANYALAYAAIADYYVWQSVYDVNPVSPKAKEFALKAIALDNRLSEAYAALGLAMLYGEYDWRASEENIRRAIELNPNNSVAHLWYSHNLYTQKRFAEGTNEVKIALELDPLSYLNHNTYSWAFYFQRNYRQALALNDALLANYPQISQAHFSRSCFLDKIGSRRAESEAAMNRAVELSPDSLFIKYGVARVLAAAGKRREVEELIALIETQSRKKYFSNYQAAIAYCYLNDVEAALEYLEKSFENRDSLLVWVAVEPSLDPVRGTARYQKILERIDHPLAAKNVSAPPNIAAEEKISLETPTESAAKKPPNFLQVVKYLAFAAILLVFGYGVYNIATHTTFTPGSSTTPRDQLWKNTFASSMNVKRLTTSGTMRLPVLSPDGKTAAYVSDEAGEQSLWTRAVDAGDARQLIAPSQVFFTDLKFSPDGQYLYYVISKMPGRALYRIPAGGGAAEKVSDNAFNMFAFSPDGTRIVYDYTNTDNNQRSLFIAELGEKALIKSAETLFVLDLPNFFPGGVAFSPDGKKIVYSRSRIERNAQVVNLFVYDSETKSNEQLVAREFDDISAVAWRKNGDEIVIAASENDSAPHQIWAVDYPSGELTRLTNDFSDYTHLSLSADSAALVAERKNSVSGVWTGEISAAGKTNETKFRQITSGVDRQDGINGVNWTKDGRILYAAGIGAERSIAVIDADGTDNRTIPTGATNPSQPSLTADNRYLFYADEKGYELNIWRFDTTNGALEKMNSRYAVTPALSPDNRSLVYAMLSGEGVNDLSVHRRSLTDGGEKPLTKGSSVRPVVSPDSRFVAVNFNGEETGGVWQIALLPLEEIGDGAAAQYFKPYTSKFFRNPQTRPLAFSPDGKFLYFLDYKETVANIFRLALGGDRAVTPITNFTSGEIFDFAFDSTGKRAAIARGSVSSDIVIYRNTR